MKHNILTKELWYSFIAIVKFIPKAIFTRQVKGMDFYTPGKLQAFTKRIQSISADSPKAWGTMTATQMLHHLSLSLGGVLGYFTLEDESYLLSRTLFKWILIDFFPAQPKGLRLPLNFVISSDQVYNFEKEKQLLLQIINKAWHTEDNKEWGNHPLLGKLTRRQWGKLAQMHIDYHLKQFNS